MQIFYMQLSHVLQLLCTSTRDLVHTHATLQPDMLQVHCNAVVHNMHGITILNMQGIPLSPQQKHKFTVFIVATATINFSLA